MDEKQNDSSPEFEQLSDTKIDGVTSDDFLIGIGQLVFNGEGIEELEKEEREEISAERKVIRDADNIYTIKHFIRDNLSLIKKDRALQVEIQKKTERLRKLIKEDGTELAAIRMTELLINDMLNEDIGEER